MCYIIALPDTFTGNPVSPLVTPLSSILLAFPFLFSLLLERPGCRTEPPSRHPCPILLLDAAASLFDPRALDTKPSRRAIARV